MADPLLACAGLQVCTIIAKNYVAQARVLARSLAATHPDTRLWTLVIDEFDGYIDPAREPFVTLTPQDIGCEPFIPMALRYSVLELSTAVKPWLLRHLMELTGEPVTYLDPDIKVFGSLARLDALAAEHGVVLTPHNLRPIPADGRRPSQVDVMISGIYNLGYVSLGRRPEVDQLLDWWAERLTRDCRVDPVWGYFVDQRWFDLAPGFVSDLAIVRDPEFNVAYWNIHERTLAGADGAYTVDGRPLAFFHFSGFDPARPLVFSRHQDRTDVTTAPVLRGLLAAYADEVLAEGHAESRDWPYSYGALGDGTRVDDRLRALYDEYADAHRADVPSPFTLAGARRLEAWLRSPAPGAPAGVSRVLRHVYEQRPDLRRSYTTREGMDGEGLRRWAREYGELEEPLIFHLMVDDTDTPDLPAAAPEAGDRVPAAPSGPASAAADGVPAQSGSAPSVKDTAPAAPDWIRAGLLSPTDRETPTAPRDTAGPLHREPFGVNVVGYFRSELGTGEAARQMVSALDATGILSLPVHGQTIPLNRQNHPYETATPEQAAFPVNLICMNADMLPEFARQAGAEFFARRYSIGLWFWEVERFPERWRDSFSLLEEVWAPTAHVASALSPLATVPVTTVRLPVAPWPAEARSRAELGLDEDRVVYLFSFDYLSVPERKNALGTIAAFRAAFAGGEGAQLVIKCINSEHAPDYHARVLAASAAHPDIRVIDGYLSPADNAGLHAACDCYVSLHRAEGFGLGMAEAMWHGKPVIATGYSGNLDFMTEANSLLVEHELVPIGPGFEPYPPDGVWAQPSVTHAAGHMRRVFDDRAFAVRLGATAAADIRRTHSPQAAGAILAQRLELIRATGRARPGPAATFGHTATLSELSRDVRRGPETDLGQHPARARLRNMVLRAMRPFTLYQRSVNRQVLAALRELGESITVARHETAVELARILAEARGASDLRALASRLEEQTRRVEALERRLGDADRLEAPDASGRG